MRKVPVNERRPVASNPDVFGEDLAKLGWMAVGLAGASFVNDKLVSPIARQVLPGVAAGGATGKALDAGTTAATAWGLGEGIGMIAGAANGRYVKAGGLVLAAGKGISVVVPGFSISASVPAALSGIVPSAAPKAVEGTNGKVVALPSAAANQTQRLGVGSIGL